MPRKDPDAPPKPRGRPRKHPLPVKLDPEEAKERSLAALEKGRENALVTNRKFTPQLGKAVIDTIKRGAPRSTAAKVAGVHPKTLATWLEKPQSDEMAVFALEVLQAEGVVEMEAIDALRSHFPKQWMASARFLENWNPDQWVRPTSNQPAVQVNVGNFGNLLKELDVIDAEVIEEGS